MILYHGSNIDIKTISLKKCKPFKDFGKGFYLTDMKEQAEKMAVRVVKIYGGNPVINIYEIDDAFREIAELTVKDFGNETSEEWAKFVMNNRSRKLLPSENILSNHDNKYDIVIGPVADDNMALLFRQYENKMIDFKTLLDGMIYKKTSSQYSFHTEKAIQCLRKVGSAL